MISSSASNAAKTMLGAAFPKIEWFEESWEVWLAALNEDGMTDGKFLHAVKEIIKHDQWFPSTALPHMVNKYTVGYVPEPSNAPRIEAVNVDREENLKQVRELAELVARGFKA